MKRAILLLVLANVALYLWRHYTDVPTTDTLPIPADIEQLVLLSERDLAMTSEIEASEITTEPEPAVLEGTTVEVADRSEKPESQPELKPVCYGLGPLASKGEADRLAKRLSQSGVQSGYRMEEMAPKEGFKYLVFIPTTDMEDAKKITEELITREVSDFYIADSKYIALGVFSDKDYAMKRMESIKQLGYTAGVREKGSARVVYWLDAMQKDPNSLTPAQRESVLSEYPKAAVEGKDCDDIALSVAGP